MPTSIRSWKKQENSRKTSTSDLLTTLKPLPVWITTNWKILKGLGIPHHLTYLMRNLQAGQEEIYRQVQVRTGHGTLVHTRKGVCQGCILPPCLFNLYAEYIMQNTRLDESQAGIKITGRNTNNFRYADDTILIA